ncbi:hypothetical protein SNE40_014321 [Patella caerulea]|uniref:Thioredoxin-like protein n=1 Tax=Patella caerulea TaxID=87958 RepID=A0AAN8PH34_PATCE
MSCNVLKTLRNKSEVDEVIRSTEDVVLVLRFGRENDTVCMLLDNILEKASTELGNMAEIYCVNADSVPVYTHYFDITFIPATIFFFNAQHMKVDWGSQDNTKYTGTFKKKQHFIDVVENIFRGAMKGKVIVNSPLDPSDIHKYDLVYNDI